MRRTQKIEHAAIATGVLDVLMTEMFVTFSALPAPQAGV